MTEIEKVELLKTKYLKLTHPFWSKEQWEKKVEQIFSEIPYKEEFSYFEQLIRELERCYTANNRYRRVLSDLIIYETNLKKKEELEKEYEELEKNRKKLFDERVKENLTWVKTFEDK